MSAPPGKPDTAAKRLARFLREYPGREEAELWLDILAADGLTAPGPEPPTDPFAWRRLEAEARRIAAEREAKYATAPPPRRRRHLRLLAPPPITEDVQ